MTGKYNS